MPATIRRMAVYMAKYRSIYTRFCTGRAGTLIFCDTSGFHKGGRVVEGQRLLFNSVYTTNAGAPVMIRQKYYTIASFKGGPLSQPAQYAIDHLKYLQ
jgi:hypothetical protein